MKIGTLYVVMENNFEYNDEVYSTPEGGGGVPVKGFTTKEKAVVHVRELTKNAMLKIESGNYSGRITEYGYEGDEILSAAGAVDAGLIEEGEEWGYDSTYDLKKLSAAQWKTILDDVGENLFAVYGVEV